jgi:alpha-ketoglutarate-dependent 2,4-dichlorophenoxyacetate dioxygenase
MELVPLGPEFGVEVRGTGLIDAAISDSVYRSIRAALEEHSVLLFREQEITDDVQEAFSRAFGPLERVKIGSVGAGTFYSRLHNIADVRHLASRLS